MIFCSDGELYVVFEITTDQFPSDVSYVLTGGGVYKSGGFDDACTTETLSWCLEQDECYTFNVADSNGDGMSSGGYSLYVNDGNIMTYTDNDKDGKSASFGNECTDTTSPPKEPDTTGNSNRRNINWTTTIVPMVLLALWGGYRYILEKKMRQAGTSSPSNNESFDINPTSENNSSSYNNNSNNDINNNNPGLSSFETITPVEVPVSTYSPSLSPSYPTISSQSYENKKATTETSGFKSVFDEMKETL